MQITPDMTILHHILASFVGKWKDIEYNGVTHREVNCHRESTDSLIVVVRKSNREG